MPADFRAQQRWTAATKSVAVMYQRSLVTSLTRRNQILRRLEMIRERPEERVLFYIQWVKG
jgi:hypothetical protein